MSIHMSIRLSPTSLLPQPFCTQPSHLHIPLQILLMDSPADPLHFHHQSLCFILPAGRSRRRGEEGTDPIHRFAQVDSCRTGRLKVVEDGFDVV